MGLTKVRNKVLDLKNTVVEDPAALRLMDLTGVKQVTLNTRGNPTYYLDTTDTVSTDDDFLVLLDKVNNRFKLVHSGIIDVKWAGAVIGQNYDSAVQKIIASGYSILITDTYTTAVQNTINTSGQLLIGTSNGKAIIVAESGFTGSSMFVFGNKSTTSVVARGGCKDITFDCNNVSGISGYEVYGLRDGSTFDNVIVSNCLLADGVVTNQAGNGTGAASGRMNQGVEFNNCHVITSNSMTGKSFWKLDGLFESTLLNCKALGASGAENSDAIGFNIGFATQSRGTNLYNCSSGNLSGVTGNARGIRYGEWAISCNDFTHTFENIKGVAVLFSGGTGDGATRPALCNSIKPRIFNGGVAGIIDPVYQYEICTSCTGQVEYYDNTKVWARFKNATPQTNNSVQIFGNVSFANLNTIVDFEVGSAQSNLAYGFTDSGSARREFKFTSTGRSYQEFANGAGIEADEFWTTFRTSSVNKLRIRDSASVSLLTVDNAAGVGDTNLTILTNDGVTSAQRVEIGGVDSGGTGYRALIVPN